MLTIMIKRRQFLYFTRNDRDNLVYPDQKSLVSFETHCLISISLPVSCKPFTECLFVCLFFLLIEFVLLV